MLALVLLAAMLGASVASFLTVVWERRRRGEPITGRSHCACGHQLSALENVPILSYVVLRGRARCCGARIPVHYVVNEIAGASIAVGILVLLLTVVDPSG